MLDKIDAHYHLWQLAKGDYWWLKNMPALNHDFMEDDFLPLMKRAGISGSIIVQALETDMETQFMLKLAAQHEWISGVIGWADCTSPKSILNLAKNNHVVGFRNWPVVRDNVEWVAGAELDAGFAALAETGLAYDALVGPNNLAALIKRLERNPNLRCCINHFAYPQPTWAVQGVEERNWQKQLKTLAQLGCCIKFSGFGHKTDGVWRPETYNRFVEFVFECFAPSQIIWASNWPTVLTECSFDDWHQACEKWTSTLSAADRALIFGGAAIQFYRLKLPRA